LGPAWQVVSAWTRVQAAIERTLTGNRSQAFHNSGKPGDIASYRTPHVLWRLNSSGSYAIFAAIRRASRYYRPFARFCSHAGTHLPIHTIWLRAPWPHRFAMHQSWHDCAALAGTAPHKKLMTTANFDRSQHCRLPFKMPFIITSRGAHFEPSVPRRREAAWRRHSRLIRRRTLCEPQGVLIEDRGGVVCLSKPY